MIIFKHAKDLQSHCSNLKIKDLTTGFVPTMGALHEGHLSLIAESRLQTDITICSIFVNPIQFNNKEDFKKYPSAIENDILLLEENGCDILFIPEENEMYPNDESRTKYFELGYLERILEGKYRPGHFQGVCIIVEKLLNVVNPSILFLGQKDYQQCLVIKKLIEITDSEIKIVICPIFREPNGLAMSSRNQRLITEEKDLASGLYKTLKKIKEELAPGKFSKLQEDAIVQLESSGFKIDYLEMAKRNTLEVVEDCNTDENYIVLIAAFLKDVRLIDNLAVTCQY